MKLTRSNSYSCTQCEKRHHKNSKIGLDHIGFKWARDPRWSKNWSGEK